MVLAAGATADRISYGNTIKKERDIARAYALGVRLYAVDCKAEVEKVARAAPGSKVFCRILSDCVGAEWPLSRKFGCEPAMAADVLEHAHKLGLEAHGISFHVGSQQTNQHAWDRALASAAAVFRECGERGMNLSMVNLGGGFPTKYLKNVPTVKAYGSAIFRALRKHFGNRIPETIIEPGRGMVGNAGIIEAEVVLVSKKSNEDEVRWVYLDLGKFGGLAETMDESIRYPIRTPRDGDAMGPCVLAGPTCNSMDVLYEKQPYELPVSLEIGDKVLIEGTGAYTSTYASVAFNGFAPLKTYPHLTRQRAPSPLAGEVRARPPQPFPRKREGTRKAGRVPCSPFAMRNRPTPPPARRCSTPPTARSASRSPRERLRAGRAPARGLSFVAVEDGRIVGTVRLWDVAAGPARPALLLGPLAVDPAQPPPRHRRGADAACAPRPPPGAAIAPCCWSATRPTTAASASRPSGPAGCGCRALPTAAACSAASSPPARSTALRGAIRAPEAAAARRCSARSRASAGLPEPRAA